MISAQTRCVCREGKPLRTRRVVARGHAFPDHAPAARRALAMTMSFSTPVAILLGGLIAGGLAYGVGVFVVMNYVVVPLSEIGRIPQFTGWTLGGNLLAMLGFGLLIAFFARGTVS